ncbi:hypothetical protein M3Y99_01740300 [Aphelenchoides fujianensis]|nr:hypothetical protein M3Y99_01740300 [Aphelenchoides fujianensis]
MVFGFGHHGNHHGHHDHHHHEHEHHHGSHHGSAEVYYPPMGSQGVAYAAPGPYYSPAQPTVVIEEGHGHGHLEHTHHHHERHHHHGHH